MRGMGAFDKCHENRSAGAGLLVDQEARAVRPATRSFGLGRLPRPRTKGGRSILVSRPANGRASHALRNRGVSPSPDGARRGRRRRSLLGRGQGREPPAARHQPRLGARACLARLTSDSRAAHSRGGLVDQDPAPDPTHAHAPSLSPRATMTRPAAPSRYARAVQ